MLDYTLELETKNLHIFCRVFPLRNPFKIVGYLKLIESVKTVMYKELSVQSVPHTYADMVLILSRVTNILFNLL